MTYYEEFGIPQDATPDEVRSAYRSLAKVMHPDQQHDEQLRQAAERQMCRLNEILAILTDERSRMSYDSSLALVTGTVKKAFHLPKRRELLTIREAGEWAVREWHFVLPGIVCAGLLVWCFFIPPPVKHLPYTSTVSHPPSPLAAWQELMPAPDQGTDRRNDRVLKEGLGLDGPVKTWDRIVPHGPRPSLPLPPEAVEEEPALPARAGATEPVLESGVLERPAVLERPVKDSSLHGTWLYVRSANTNSPKLKYEPTYIEMVVTNDAPEFQGRYRGRYRAPANTIYPEVSFAFQGNSDGTFRWTTTNGARGEGILKLLTAESLEVNWWTTVATDEPSLASGTAVLIRLRAQ